MGKLTEDQSRSIVDRYRAGEGIEAIVASIGVSKRSVYNILERNGIERRNKVTTQDEDRDDQIVKLYRQGVPAYEIAGRFGVHPQTVYNVLKRQEVDVHSEKTRLDAESRQAVAEMGLNGAKYAELQEQFGISEKTVSRILGEHNVALPKGRPPECDVDHGAFDMITPESAYWMGFLFSDGCVHQDEYGAPILAVGLSEKDVGHLEKLRAFLKSTHAVYPSEKTATSHGEAFAHFRVRSDRIANRLLQLGFGQKETRVPADGTLAASRDFWRGCVDGDGVVGTVSKDGFIEAEIRLSGHRPLLGQYGAFLSLNGCKCPNIVLAGERTGSVFEMRVAGVEAMRIIKLLYGGVENHGAVLERKNVRAQTLLQGLKRMI